MTSIEFADALRVLRAGCAAVTLVGLCGALPAAAQGSAPAGEVSAPVSAPATGAQLSPEERIRLLEQQLDTLRRELDSLRTQVQQTPKPPTPAPTNPTPPGTGSTPSAAANPARVTVEPYGYIQSQFETTPPGDDLRFLMRRVRLGVRGQAGEDWRYQLQAELATDTRILRDAFVDYTGWQGNIARFGQFKVPFSYEGFASTTVLPTIERSFIIEEVYHERDAGIAVLSQMDPKKPYGYGVSLVNGSGRNRFTANNDLLFVGRAQLNTPENRPLLGGQLAVGFSTQQGDVVNESLGRREEAAYGVDATYTRGPLLLRGEWARGELDGRGVDGWYALGTYLFTPKWEGVFRYDEFDGMEDAERWTFGLNYYVSRKTRLMLNYEAVSGQPPLNTGSGVRLRLQQLFP